nr:hypothetical protein SrhCFBP13529_11710 [Stenotrophomonas rhizophila]
MLAGIQPGEQGTRRRPAAPQATGWVGGPQPGRARLYEERDSQARDIAVAQPGRARLYEERDSQARDIAVAQPGRARLYERRPEPTAEAAISGSATPCVAGQTMTKTDAWQARQ